MTDTPQSASPSQEAREAAALELSVGMSKPVIYHGTPMTPRAALNAVMPGRAGCVSFYRPDDLEVLLAVCPHLMFRQRRFLALDGSDAPWPRMGSGKSRSVVVNLLLMVRAASGSVRTMGGHSRQPGCSIANQRRSAKRLAVRSRAWCAGVAHERTNRPAGTSLRTIRSRMPRLDRPPEARASGLRRLPLENGRGSDVDGRGLAPAAHAARLGRGVRLSVRQRGQHKPCAERMAV